MSEHQHVEEDDIEREELGQFLNRLNFRILRMFQRSKGWIPGLLSKPKNPHSLEHLKWVTDIWSISIVGIIKYRDVVCTSLIIIFDITNLQKRCHVYVRISPLNPTELFTGVVYLVNSWDLYLLFENEPNVRCTVHVRLSTCNYINSYKADQSFS